MTIKEFASLCGCSAQTLRYYDRIGLLRPDNVDPWTGYRHYTAPQAVDFVKIKNLQAADFTISEIRSLLTKPDSEVYNAFEQKLTEQTQKLERIKYIQQSWLTEKNNMEKLVQNVAEYLVHAATDYEVLREFGLAPTQGPAVVAKVKAYLEAATLRHLPAAPDVCLVINDQVIYGADRAAETFAALTENEFKYDDTVLLGDESILKDEGFTQENSETVWERHGWSFVYEFLDSIPRMEKDREYCCTFHMTADKYSEKLEFPLFMLGVMLTKTKTDDIIIGCSVERSPDDKNHFALLRKKQ